MAKAPHPDRQPALSPVHANAAAIDRGATLHVAAVPPDRDACPVRTLGTFTSDLHRMAAWFKACGIATVVSYDDAAACAAWAGKELPTEAEWEFAAWGGREGVEFAWGDELEPGGRHAVNVWQGAFPWQNDCADGFARTSPVGNFPANGFGLYDMIGNVWEWTRDWYRARHPAAARPCCIPVNPRGGPRSDSHDRCDAVPIPRKVVKGGSHLCAPNYCRRYRPAARHPHPVDTSTSHIGFRCVRRR